MVKGNSRQVIVVNAPDQKLFEQAIFILKDDAVAAGGIPDEALLREAKRLIKSGNKPRKKNPVYGMVWACAGAVVTGLAWLLSVLL